MRDFCVVCALNALQLVLVPLASRSGFLVVDRNGKVRLALMGTIPPRQLVELVRYTMTGF